MRFINSGILFAVALTGFCVVSMAQNQNTTVPVYRLNSSYIAPETPWLRGNLHTHTTESDGKQPPQEVVDGYARAGYDFLMISDHDKITNVAALDPKGMTLLPGDEISAKGPHLLHVNAGGYVAPDADRQKVINDIAAAGGFAIMNHPNWTANYNHCPLETLEALNGYVGIEIFNGVILLLEGSELATDKWDRLLAKGRHIWGFATDDSHSHPDQDAKGWEMVQSASRAAGDIAEAMRLGRFYASTGVKVNSITTQGLMVSVSSENTQRFRVYSDNGKVIHFADGPEMTYTVTPDKGRTYIRVECYGPGDQMAWLQPMFIEAVPGN
jgi:hypothetical protein